MTSILINFVDSSKLKITSFLNLCNSTIFNSETTANNSRPAIPGSDEIISQILPNVWVLVAHAIATIILLSLIVWLVWKPTKKYLEKRKNQILKDINEAKEKNDIADKNFEISKKELLESKQAASAIIQNATIEGENIKNKMEQVALKRVSYLESEADHNIKKQEEIASLKMNQKASLLAIDIAETFLNKKIDSDENKKMIDSILKDLSDESKK